MPVPISFRLSAEVSFIGNFTKGSNESEFFFERGCLTPKEKL
jgi:hypothetical protein